MAEEFRSYWQRWYILFLFSAQSFLQSYIWNQWGPMFDSMKIIFKWDDAQLARLPFYGSIVLTVLVMPSARLLERYGIRKNLLALCALQFGSVIVRCVPIYNIRLQNGLINASAFLNALAGVNVYYFPSVLAAKWFPPKERNFATSIGIQSMGLGVASAFLIGPYSVPQPVNKDPLSILYSVHCYFYFTYAQTVLVGIFGILTLLYCPDQPITPPSLSANLPRRSDLSGAIDVLKQIEFWLIAIPVTILQGSFQGWEPVVTVTLLKDHISQVNAGWIGFWACVAAAVFGLFFGKLADIFSTRLKAIITALTIITIEGSLWVWLIDQRRIVPGLGSSYASVVITAIGSVSLMSLCFDLAAEVCYPIDEATIVGYLSFLINLVSSIFLAVLFIPNISIGWMTSWMVAASCISLPFCFFLPTNRRRSITDHQKDEHDSICDTTDTEQPNPLIV